MTATLNTRRIVTDLSERAAICASVACLAHCLALPLILLLLPSLAALLDIPETFHVWVLAFAIPTAVSALGSGWLGHRVVMPLVAGISGLVLLSVGAVVFGETHWEVPVTVAGSLTLAAAHVANWRLRHRSECACDC